MRKYQIVQENGEVLDAHYIGMNHCLDGSIIDDTISSYSADFDNKDEVTIGNNRHCVIGNINDAYKYLREEITSKEPHRLDEYAECINQVVMRYFGNFYYARKRLSYFPSDEEIKNKGKKMGKVSDLKNKNAALCVERAMLSQNLLGTLGFKSFYKASAVIINGETESHAYNLVSNDGKYYIFDTTIPTIIDGRINPLVCEISEEVYEYLSKPNADIGYSVYVRHLNPLQNKECEIIYDAGRDMVYHVKKPFVKKRVNDEIF